MSKGLFITGTDTDIGKTYVTALIVKTMRQAGYDAGYYKAAISGAPTVAASDAGFVNKFADIHEPEDMILSYLYQHAVSPHLAAKLEGHPLEKEVILKAWKRVTEAYPYVTMEGSGGIVCPLRWDAEQHVILDDLVVKLGLPVLVVADAGLGTINAVVLTIEHLRMRQLSVAGIIFNNSHPNSFMEEDNAMMVKELTGVDVVAYVQPGDKALRMDTEKLAALYA